MEHVNVNVVEGQANLGAQVVPFVEGNLRVFTDVVVVSSTIIGTTSKQKS